MADLLATVPNRVRLRPPRAARSAPASLLTREVGLVLVALGSLNGSSYLLHVVLSRLLGPTAYGALAALLALMMVLSVPIGVVQTIVARRVAALRGAGLSAEASAVGPETVKGLTGIAVLVLVGTLAAAPAFAYFLNVGLVSALLLGPLIVLGLLASAPLGVLQGRREFGRLATAIVTSTVVRLAAAVGLVAAGLGIGGAILASLLAQGLLLGLAFVLLRLPPRSWSAARLSLRPFHGQVAQTALGLGGFWLLAELDIVLARHYLPHTESGYYSAAGLLARGALFVAAPVSLAALPYFSQDRRRVEAFRWLRPMLGIVSVLGVASFAGLALLRGPLVELAFGPGYAQAAPLVPLLALAATLLAVVNLLTYFHIATETRANLFIFGGLGAETALIALFHETPTQFAAILASVSAAVAALQLYAAAAACHEYPTIADRRLGFAETPAPSEHPDVDISVVLPCRNVGPMLTRVLRGVGRELRGVTPYELIVVSDGSMDDTVHIASSLSDERIRVLHYPEQIGKGHALQLGLSAAHGRYVAFLDGDGDIDPQSIPVFVELMRLFEPDIVLGSKRHPLSEVSYPPLRRVLSWGYHRIGRVLFRVDVRDTQTGCKLIRREVLEAVLPRIHEKRYAFDLELLVVARRLGFDRIFEAPVRIQYRFSSQINLGSVLGIIRDTVAIFFRHYILNTYRTHTPADSIVPDRRPPAARRVRSRSAAPRGSGAMRILVLNWRDLGNPDAGGAEVWTHEVAKRWAAAGHDVSMLTSGFPGGAGTSTLDDVAIRRVGRLRTGSFHLAVQRELARLRGFDVVIDEINSVPFLTPLWRRRLPPIVTLVFQLAVEVWDYELSRPFAALGRWAEPRLLGLYRDLPVVAISESTQADLEALGLSDVQVVHPGLDPPPELGSVTKERSPTFLFAGRLAANKRPDHAVEAFRSLRRSVPDARLWIAGRGPTENALRESLPEGAELLGYLSREELYRRMARAHVLLVPSVREGWGLVVVEANSVGTPAVGYDVPGIRDSIIDGATGLLATTGDPDDLASAAITLIADPARYAALQAAARERARRFTWEATADSFLGILEAEVDRRHRSTQPSAPVPAPCAAAASGR
jgi:glycosyltransferase involved in cell wall biosynthesis/O-antigen/teichoic acid export membrane protein